MASGLVGLFSFAVALEGFWLVRTGPAVSHIDADQRVEIDRMRRLLLQLPA